MGEEHREPAAPGTRVRNVNPGLCRGAAARARITLGVCLGGQQPNPGHKGPTPLRPPRKVLVTPPGTPRPFCCRSQGLAPSGNRQLEGRMMILFKFLSLFLVKSSGFGAVCPMGISSKNSDSGFFFSPEPGKTPDAEREVNCGSDKAQEISTIRGKTMLIIKINTNSRLMGAWLPSARGREQDPLPAEPLQLVRGVCGQAEPPVLAWMPKTPQLEVSDRTSCGRSDSQQDLIPRGLGGLVPHSPGPPLQPCSLGCWSLRTCCSW